MPQPFALSVELQFKAPRISGAARKSIEDSLRGLKIPIDFQVRSAGLSSFNQQVRDGQKNLRSFQGDVGTTTRSLRGLEAGYTATSRGLTQLNASHSMATGRLRQFTQETKLADRATQQLGRQLGDQTRRLLTYSLAASGIYGLVRAMQSGVREAIAFEREMVKLTQQGAAVQEVREMERAIGRLSSSLGVSSKELAGVAVTFQQTGMAMKDVEKATEAIAKASLAPNFGSMKEATEGAISVMRIFNVDAGHMEKALGAINSVAGAFASESRDLIIGVQRAGASFAAAGGSLNQLLALMSTVRSTTRESAESIATGLKTIFTRIQRPETIESLKELGINLHNTEGQFIGAYEAVMKLSSAMKNLRSTDPRYMSIVEELGGYRQVSKLLPLLQQTTEAQKAYMVAQYGSLSLSSAAAKAQETLAVRIEKLKESFYSLARTIVSSDAFQGFANSMLFLANAAVKLTNAFTPLLPLIVGMGAVRLFKGFGSGLAGQTVSSRRFATGGHVPGSGDRDTTVIAATPGEYVIRKQAAKTLGSSALGYMNRTGRIPKYSTGEYVIGNPDIQTVLEEFQAKTGMNIKNLVGSIDFVDTLPLHEASGKPKRGRYLHYKSGRGKIEVNRSEVKTIEDLRRNLAHELGHALDYQLGRGTPASLQGDTKAALYAKIQSVSQLKSDIEAYGKPFIGDHAKYRYGEKESFANYFRKYLLGELNEEHSQAFHNDVIGRGKRLVGVAPTVAMPRQPIVAEAGWNKAKPTNIFDFADIAKSHPHLLPQITQEADRSGLKLLGGTPIKLSKAGEFVSFPTFKTNKGIQTAEQNIEELAKLSTNPAALERYTQAMKDKSIERAIYATKGKRADPTSPLYMRLQRLLAKAALEHEGDSTTPFEPFPYLRRGATDAIRDISILKENRKRRASILVGPEGEFTNLLDQMQSSSFGTQSPAEVAVAREEAALQAKAQSAQSTAAGKTNAQVAAESKAKMAARRRAAKPTFTTSPAAAPPAPPVKPPTVTTTAAPSPGDYGSGINYRPIRPGFSYSTPGGNPLSMSHLTSMASPSSDAYKRLQTELAGKHFYDPEFQRSWAYAARLIKRGELSYQEWQALGMGRMVGATVPSSSVFSPATMQALGMSGAPASFPTRPIVPHHQMFGNTVPEFFPPSLRGRRLEPELPSVISDWTKGRPQDVLSPRDYVKWLDSQTHVHGRAPILSHGPTGNRVSPIGGTDVHDVEALALMAYNDVGNPPVNKWLAKHRKREEKRQKAFSAKERREDSALLKAVGGYQNHFDSFDENHRPSNLLEGLDVPGPTRFERAKGYLGGRLRGLGSRIADSRAYRGLHAVNSALQTGLGQGLMFGSTALAGYIQQYAGTADEAVARNRTGGYTASHGASGLLIGASTGAMLGSVIPGVGTAIGAVAGGLTALVVSLNSASNEIKEAKLGKAMKETASALASIKGGRATEAQADALIKDFESKDNVLRRNARKASRHIRNPAVRELKFEEVYHAELEKQFGSLAGEKARVLSEAAEQAGAKAPNLESLRKRFLGGNFGANEALLNQLAAITKSHPDTILENMLKIGTTSFNRKEAEEDKVKGSIAENNLLLQYRTLSMGAQQASFRQAGLRSRAQVSANLFGGQFAPIHVAGGIGTDIGMLGGPDEAAYLASLKAIATPFGARGQELLKRATNISNIHTALPGILQESLTPGALEEPEQYAHNIMKRLRASLGGEEAISKDKNLSQMVALISTELHSKNPKELVESARSGDFHGIIQQLMSKSTSQLSEAGSSMAHTVTEQAKELTDGLHQSAVMLRQINEGQYRVAQAKLQQTLISTKFSSLQQGIEHGYLNSVSLDTLNAPFANRQRLLAGGNAFNVAGISQEMADVRKSLGLAVEERNHLAQNGGSAAQMITAGEKIEQLGTRLANLNDALEHLKNTAESTAGAEMKLQAVTQDRSSRLSYGERFLTGDLGTRSQMIRGERLVRLAAARGSIANFSPMNQRLVIETLNGLGNARLGALGGINAQDLKNKLITQAIPNLGLQPGGDLQKEMVDLQKQILDAIKRGVEAEVALLEQQKANRKDFDDAQKKAAEDFSKRIKGEDNSNKKPKPAPIVNPNPNFWIPPGNSVPAPRFASGGRVGGPKGTDTVPAWLTPGEFVVKASAASQHRSLLNAINGGNTYSEGGVVYAANGGRIHVPRAHLPVLNPIAGTIIGSLAKQWRVTPTTAYQYMMMAQHLGNVGNGPIENLPARLRQSMLAQRRAYFQGLNQQMLGAGAGLHGHRPGFVGPRIPRRMFSPQEMRQRLGPFHETVGLDEVQRREDTIKGRIDAGVQHRNLVEKQQAARMAYGASYYKGHGVPASAHSSYVRISPNATPTRHFASGGYVDGASGTDAIPAQLTRGEYVLHPNAVRAVGRNNLDAINNGHRRANSPQGFGIPADFTKTIQSFTQSMTSWTHLMTGFNSSAQVLAKALEAMPQTVNMQAQHTHNHHHFGLSEGSEKFAESVNEMVSGSLKGIVKDLFKQAFPQAGII